MSASVSTIPIHLPFIKTLAQALLAEADRGGLELERSVIFLPTRRACLGLRDALLQARGGQPLLLPQMRPLGDVDELEDGTGADVAVGVLQPVSALERWLLLAAQVEAGQQLLGQTESSQGTAKQALLLARALAELWDGMLIEEVSLEHLESLVPQVMETHWRKMLGFMDIVRAHWPQILASRHVQDVAVLHRQMLDNLGESWTRSPPQGMVMVAGSTGSQPATRRFMVAVSRLPQGRVVLPGWLEMTGQEQAMVATQASHPQHAMVRFVQESQSASIPEYGEGMTGGSVERAVWIRHAFAPEGLPTSGARTEMEKAQQGCYRLEATNDSEEAACIAVLMREVLETPERTAVLITPHQALARQVRLRLEAWGCVVDDSAGVAVLQSPPGLFLRRILRLCTQPFSHGALLEVMGHPLTDAAHRRRRHRLERDLRGQVPDATFAAWCARTENGAHLRQAFEPLLALMEKHPEGMHPLSDWVAAHCRTAERLGPGLWQSEAGELLAQRLAELMRPELNVIKPLDGRAYSHCFELLLQDMVVRPRHRIHPRLQILGPLESRLLSADRVILGGLVEEVWPRAMAPDPWMSLSMRTQLNLLNPERRMGLQAHDFTQALGAGGEVYLTWAHKHGGQPQVPSRWLTRLEVALQAQGVEMDTVRPAAILGWARALDRYGTTIPCPPPASTPPVAARPQEISVTAIGQWMRNPYGFYAQRILGLREAKPLDQDIDSRIAGTIVHELIEDFLKSETPDPRPRIAEFLDACRLRPGQRQLWTQGLTDVLDAIGAREDGWVQSLLETQGSLPLEGLNFTLTARADCLAVDHEGALWVIDYKTGAMPSYVDMRRGLQAQMPLEVWMAQNGGFELKPQGEVQGEVRGAFWEVKPTKGQWKPKKLTDSKWERALAEVPRSLQQLVAAFQRPDTPYLAYPRAHLYKPYPNELTDHLSRRDEWQG